MQGRLVVRDRIELSTFRFSGRTFALTRQNDPAWAVVAGRSWLPVVVVVVVNAVVTLAQLVSGVAALYALAHKPACLIIPSPSAHPTGSGFAWPMVMG